MSSSSLLKVLLISAAAVLIHGYHLGADDGAIYVPAIKSVADPSLYPFGSEFFMSHAHLSLFSNMVGDSARLTGLPVDLVIFAWHVTGIFLLLLAAWKLAGQCFESEGARWSGVILLAGMLSVPVAGTALAVMDPYLTARSLSTPATLFAIACWLSLQRKQAAAWLLFTFLIHPHMSVFAAAFLGFLELSRRAIPVVPRNEAVAMAAGIPFLFPFRAASGPARDALFSRTYFFVYQWTWYEWAGILAPLVLLWALASVKLRGTTPVFRIVAGTLVPFGMLFTAAGLLVGMPVWLENYTRLQPMRSFHLLYVVLFVLVGGLVQEYALKTRVRRWLLLFAPMAAGMWCMQMTAYPASLHVEWPGERSENTWNRAFLWIRGHTPKNAVFALDPQYMSSPGEDMHGFRAVAERSMLADSLKDSGAVSLFPQLADDWRSQTQAEIGWQHFKLQDYEKLAAEFPVTWILTRSPAPAGMACPYYNRDFAVCRIPRPLP
jgi:hypothetical protein